MVPRNAYKDMLDNVVSLITCVSMNHQNQLEQMTNRAMFAIARGWKGAVGVWRCFWNSKHGPHSKSARFMKKNKFECF
jgi:hypothetical protein